MPPICKEYRCGDACIELESHEKNEYASNLDMTGYAIWFAAQNMCNYLRDHLMSGDFDTTGSTLELGAGSCGHLNIIKATNCIKEPIIKNLKVNRSIHPTKKCCVTRIAV